MLILRDLYTQSATQTLVTADGETIGWTVIQYEVHAYTDARNQATVKSYLVTGTQRVAVSNPTVYATSIMQNHAPITSYADYPALISNNITVLDPEQCLNDWHLLDYAPRTMNTSVSTSQNMAQSTNQGTTQQYTSGSSTSQTNTYGVSGSLGFAGKALTGDVSGNYQYSTSTEQSRAFSAGTALDRGIQSSISESMSIKDWGSYGLVDQNYKNIGWIWGQEYPWNVILFCGGNNSLGSVPLPDYIQQRLLEGKLVYPPSELSLMGCDFSSRATWLITPRPNALAATVTFNHDAAYGSATHGLDGNGNFSASVTYSSLESLPKLVLDLGVLALDPILASDRTAAIIGFLPNKFDVLPSGSAFQIVADGNNLLARGAGFDAGMTTSFTHPNVQMTLYFKIVDSLRNIVLSLKHWTQASGAVKLSVIVNGGPTLTKFVDAPEAGSGGDNLTEISLRNIDFSSTDYCDYLQLGLNTIQIQFAPADTSVPTVYQIMALAVG